MNFVNLEPMIERNRYNQIILLKQIQILTNSTRPKPPTPNVEIISILAKRRVFKSRSSSPLMYVALKSYVVKYQT